MSKQREPVAPLPAPRRTADVIWRELPREVRVEAARLFWNSKCRSDEALLRAKTLLALKLHFRPQFVERLSPVRSAEYLASFVRLPADLAASLLICLHLDGRQELLGCFLDALRIPHERGNIKSERNAPPLVPPSAEAVVRAIERLRSRFASAQVDTYLDTLELQELAVLVHLPEARATDRLRPATQESAAARAEAAPTPAADVEEPSGPADLPEASIDEFKTLDEVLIRTIVASAAEASSALNQDRALDLVEEVVALNPERHHSHFHRGFFDAMFRRPIELTGREVNESRSVWYLTGATMAFRRRGDDDAICALVDRFGETLKALEEPPYAGAAVQASPQLFRALARRGRFVAAAGFLTERVIATAGPKLAGEILETAGELLRQSRPDEADPLLRILHRTLQRLEPHGRVRQLQATLERRRAHCARLRGAFDAARAILNDQLDVEENGAIRGDLRADLGLIDANFRALAGIVIPPSRSEFDDTARALARGEGEFRKGAAESRAWRAAHDDAGHNHSDYCIGMLLFFRQKWAEAAPYLRTAVASMGSLPHVYDPFLVLPRARFALGICLAYDVDPATLEYSIECLKASASRLLKAPVDVLVSAIESMSVVDFDRAGALANDLVPSLGSRFVAALADCQVGRRLPAVRAALESVARDERRHRDERFTAARQLLRGGVETNESPVVANALDLLEDVSDRLPQTEQFFALLEDSRNYEGAWDPDDADAAKVRLLTRLGRCEAAANLLIDLCHRVLAGESRTRDVEAEDLLDEIRGLGVTGFEAVQQTIERRIEAARPRDQVEARAAPAAVAANPVRGVVSFFGGNETQAQYDDDIRREVHRRFPNVTIHFKHTGWSANWGRQLGDLERDVDRSDAVVLMRFMRTNLGRALRKRCSVAAKPWVACTGHGHQSVRRALEGAISLIDGNRNGGR